MQKQLKTRTNCHRSNKAHSRRERATRIPYANELPGALVEGVAEGLVRRDGVEPFGLRLALVSQEVNQTQCLTRSS